MKTQFTLAALVFVIVCNAQSQRVLRTDQSTDVISFLDSFESFRIADVDSSAAIYKPITFQLQNESSRMVLVKFGRENQGNTFKLDEVVGTYKDLFPVWKKYFEPEANFDAIANHKTKTGTANHFVALTVDERERKVNFFKTGADEWRIKVRP